MNNIYFNFYYIFYIFYFIVWFYKIINNLFFELNIFFVVIKVGIEMDRRYIELKYLKLFFLV